MTIRSREIALRCASSLPPRLLAHGYSHRRPDDQDTLYTIGMEGARIGAELAEQLTRCQDESAQRLILGISK